MCVLDVKEWLNVCSGCERMVKCRYFAMLTLGGWVIFKGFGCENVSGMKAWWVLKYGNVLGQIHQ